jgi:hypothetical protein
MIRSRHMQDSPSTNQILLRSVVCVLNMPVGDGSRQFVVIGVLVITTYFYAIFT